MIKKKKKIFSKKLTQLKKKKKSPRGSLKTQKSLCFSKTFFGESKKPYFFSKVISKRNNDFFKLF